MCRLYDNFYKMCTSLIDSIINDTRCIDSTPNCMRCVSNVPALDRA